MSPDLFGADFAQDDPLLKTCFVGPKQGTDKSIVVGRWGVGKTALLFQDTLSLADVLESYSPGDKNLWYIGELALDLQTLLDIRSSLGGDPERFTRALEDVWTAEITRSFSLILWKLHAYYGSPQGAHWTAVIDFAKGQGAGVAFFRRVAPLVLGAVTGDDAKVRYVRNLLEEARTVSRGLSLQQLEQCVRDVAVHSDKVQPMLILEPIDTPISTIEDGPLAGPVVASLLNVFYRHFRPSEEHTIKLRISVPWHRYAPADLDFPQRFPQYVGRIDWDPDTLRSFITTRIAHELDRVKRSQRGKDPWTDLFPESVVDDHYGAGVREDSFQYFLRHTHYRPRDLLRLVRRAVEEEAANGKVSIDEVLLGRRGNRGVSEKSVINCVRRECAWLMADEFTVEIRRKWSTQIMDQMMDILRRLPIPFSTDDLSSRIRRVAGKDASSADFNNIVGQLWNSGIIGVEIVPKSDKAIDPLRRFLGSEAFVQYTGSRKQYHRWYFFNYNWNREPMELFDAYVASEDAEAKWVLHPSTFQFLAPRLDAECPIGV